MSTGTNQERIQQNNTKLATLKTKADNLPEYQDIKPILANSDYKLIETPIASTFNKYNISYVDDYIGVWYSTYPNYYFNIYKVNNDNSLTTVFSQYYGGQVAASLIDVDDQYIYYTVMSTGSPRYITVYRISIEDYSAIDSFNINTANYYSGDIYQFDRNILELGNSGFLVNIDVQNRTYSVVSYIGMIFLTPDITVTNRSSVDNYTSINSIKKISNDKSCNQTNINFVNYDATKIIVNNSLYYLNSNMTLGEKIKDNCLDTTLYSNYYIFSYVCKDIYIMRINTGKTSSGAFYRFNETTNTFELINTLNNVRAQGGNSDSCGWLNGFSNTSNKLCLYVPINKTAIVGYTYNNTEFYFHKDYGINNPSVLNNTTLFDYYGNVVTGTMPNNEILSYIPTTSQQSIPAGYTSGGTIYAVTSDIDSNISAGNIKDGVTILGVEGTYEGDYSQTLTPAEYDEAVETTEDILGITPEPEVQDHYEIEYD